QAIAEEPSWRLLWLRELADQMTYAGFAEKAVPLYEEYLDSGTASPEDALRARLGLALALSWTDQLEQSLKEYEALLADDPGNRDAQLGRARVLSWRDRQGPSREAYVEVLAQDPLNAEARRSLGRVQSWRGRQRDAQRQLSEFVAENPDDNEGVFLLAQSQDWMGRPDKAKKTLERHLQNSPDDTRSRELLKDIEFRERPATRVDYQESHQSDQLTIHGISAEQNVFLNDGRTVVGPRYQFYRFNQKKTDVDHINVNRPGLYARHRISDSLQWAGAAFIDLIDVEGARKDREIFTYDTSLTYWPNDLLRFDVGSSRTTFDNLTSLRRGIAANFANFSVDVTPDELTRITGRYNWGDFTDGNVRNWGQAEIERRIWNHPALFVGYQYTGFDFRREFNNGYYNPDTYNSNELIMRTTGLLGERFTYQFDGGYGAEQATPGGQQSIWRAGTSLNYSIFDRLTIGGRYNYFSSATASSGGFERGTTGVNVQFVW
ncbi:MAG: tetratricopeptide repeat protein, partial [Deltaproteobacteria bacterium]|nr:tetratricopeptide repeat protein [Deltaproteobacteria bacterium]